jgi:Tfp pilus assembly major pilin PilA
MNKQKYQQGFTIVELFLTIGVIVLIGAVGWLVYKNHSDTSKSSTNTAQKSNTNSTTKNSTATSSSTVNPYSGWKTYTTQYQKLALKYPSNWQLSDVSNRYGNGPDEIDITSPNNTYDLNFQATNPTDTIQTLPATYESINFTGQSDYLVFYPSDTNPNPNYISRVYVSASTSNYTMPAIPASDVSGGISLWGIIFSPTTPMNLTDLLNSNELQQAKLIIESAKY